VPILDSGKSALLMEGRASATTPMGEHQTQPRDPTGQVLTIYADFTHIPGIAALRLWLLRPKGI
jgi:hypothetical protein